MPDPPTPELLPEPLDDEFEVFFPGRDSKSNDDPDKDVEPLIQGVPSRGPQSPMSEDLHMKLTDYSDPPPRAGSKKSERLTAPNVNSQASPSKHVEEYYIPPRTENDVPKNFKRPQDVVPEEADVEDFGVGLDIETFDPLEELFQGDREPFLGLAKFSKPEAEPISKAEEKRKKFEKLRKKEPTAPGKKQSTMLEPNYRSLWNERYGILPHIYANFPVLPPIPTFPTVPIAPTATTIPTMPIVPGMYILFLAIVN